MSDPNAAPPEDPTEMAAAAAAAAVGYSMPAHASGDAAAAAAVPEGKWNKNGYGVPVAKQSGKFTKEESQIVRKAVEEYCAVKGITASRLCSECDHKAELKGAWMEIAKRLPHRSVQSVYRHGIRQLHPFKRGAWSEQECTLLQELVQRLGKKWSSIQNKLNRSADSCRDKYREMSDDYVKGRWKEPETEMLQRLIREQLNADPSASMRDLAKMCEEQNIQIPWSKISKDMGKRSRLSCFKKWQKMSGLTSTTTISSEEQQQEFVKRKVGDDDDIVEQDEQVVYKRQKTDDDERAAPQQLEAAQKMAYAVAPTAGAAAAMAAAAGQQQQGDNFDVYSAKIAAETVEAVELPDTDALVPNVREI